ncbi:hypothetical protein MBAV_005322 [Candidatus Magnetobacterium bavaricum]|uniref:Uncharacterized protein n=1 Tax=Candidatus Magnetobacterium bavaricum TaxID=29290 RepID=A0A0F3GKJ9_9BACT|nr:hypothetical protein MBAV_005322 [Candidatus Magnetobacterium bavaricum]
MLALPPCAVGFETASVSSVLVASRFTTSALKSASLIELISLRVCFRPGRFSAFLTTLVSPMNTIRRPVRCACALSATSAPTPPGSPNVTRTILSFNIISYTCF